MYKSKRIIAILSALVLTFNNILITSASAVSSEEIVVTTVPDSSEVTDITTVVPDMPDSDNNTSISSSDAVTSNSESISYIIDGTRKEYTSTDIKDINEFTQVAETVDPNTTSVEIAPGIPLEGVELEEFKTQTAPQYPKDWKTWKRSNPLWSDIKIGNSTVGIVGSPLIAIAKLLVQNNAIPNQGFNPADYCEWVSSNNIIGEDNRINDWNDLLKYAPSDAEDKENYLLNKLEFKGSVMLAVKTPSLIEESVSTSNSSESGEEQSQQSVSLNTVEEEDFYEDTQGAIKVIDKYRKAGYGVILKLNNSEYVLVGNAITVNDKLDYEVYGSASTDSQYVSEYPDKKIMRIDLYKGNVNMVASGVEAVVDAAKGEAEKNEVLGYEHSYRLSNYTETQKEVLALVKNKYMTQNDVAAFKWNMIVSQFAIPYKENLDDVLESEQWKEIYNISSVNYEDVYGYNTTLAEGANKYLTYLKSKSSEVKTVLDILKGDNVYTPIYNENGSIATISDMVTGNVLYIKDNYGLLGDESDEDSKESANKSKEGIIVTQSGETVSETTTEQVTTVSDSTSSESDSSTTQGKQSNSLKAYKGSIEKFYEVLNGEKKSVYDSILEGSDVHEIMIPCYINTDSTYMYNTTFLYNAMRYSTTDSISDINKYYESVKSELLYLDQYGNICIKTNPSGEYNDTTAYTLVYPSYANSMYISTEIADDEIAGVLYESYNDIITIDSATLDGKNKNVAVFNDNVIKNYQDMKGHLNQSNLTEETYFGFNSNTVNGAFQINELLDFSKKPVSDYKFNRYNGVDSGTEPLVYARIDTTSNFLGNLTILAMTYSPEQLDEKVPKGLGQSDNLTALSNMRPYVSYKPEESTTTTVATSETTGDVTTEPPKTTGTTGTESSVTIEGFTFERNSYKKSVNDYNATSGLLGIEKYLAFPVMALTGNPNTITSNGHNISNGDYSINVGKHSSDGGYLCTIPSTIAYNGANGYERHANSGGYSIPSSNYPYVAYPYLTQFEAVKGNYTLPGLANVPNIGSRNALSNLRYALNSVSSATDHNNTGINSGENLWLMSMIDAEKYTTSFRLAGNLYEGETSGVGDSNNSIYNGKVADSPYLNKEISHYFDEDDLFPQNTTNILDWVLDDTAGWGLWDIGDDKSINVKRGSLLMESDLEYTNVALSVSSSGYDDFSHSDKYGLFCNIRSKQASLSSYTHSSWYMLTNSIVVSPNLNKYSVSDILNIAYVWDMYYINNTPLTTKAELKSVDGTKFYADKKNEDNNDEEKTTEETEVAETSESSGSENSNGQTQKKPADDKGIVITPYNLTNETNNNNLFYTKHSFISNQLISHNSYTEDGVLTSSEISASIPVYSVHYNAPLLMMCTYRNGYGENLERWVNALEDEGSQARYIMDLITQFTKNPITGVTNMVMGCMQLLHNSISKSTIGKLLNLTSLTEFIIMGDLLQWYLIAHVLILMFIIIRIITRYIMSRKKFPKELLVRAMSIGFAPILILFATKDLINIINSYMYRDLNIKVAITEIEHTINPTPKEIYGKDTDIMLDSMYYESEDASDINIKFKFDDATDVDISLLQLYNSISINGTTECQYIDERKNQLWYRSDKFVPVNYERYNDSVFYYFYDYLRYQYLGYCEKSGEYSTTAYNVEEITNIADYTKVMLELDNKYLKEKGHFIKMYTDMSYTNIGSNNTDLLGLSNLFNFTDASGQLLTYYNDSLDFESIINSYKNETQGATPTNHDTFIWPLAHLYDSTYFKDYTDNLYMKGDYKTPMHRWKFNPLTLPTDDGRIPYRVYGSIAQLQSHSDKASPTDLEIKLNSINKKFYNDVFDMISIYEEDVITDDVYIFVSALYATFAFNSVMGDNIYPTSLNMDSISVDKLFKAIYSKDIKQAVGEDNLIYMIQKSYGAACAILVTLSGVVFAIAMLVMSIMYLVLFVSICLSTFLTDEYQVKQSIKRVASYTTVLIAFQILINLLLTFTSDMIMQSTGKITACLVSLIVLVGCICTLTWAIKTLTGLVKNLTTFGGDVVWQMIDGFALQFRNKMHNIRSNALKSNNNLLRNVSTSMIGNDRKQSTSNSRSIINNKTVRRHFRRKQNISKRSGKK